METITDRKNELIQRQEEFAAMLGIDMAEVRHLKLCSVCHGHDYAWTDWSSSEIDVVGLGIETGQALAYRNYLAETLCTDCGGTGFEGGQEFLT